MRYTVDILLAEIKCYDLLVYTICLPNLDQTRSLSVISEVLFHLQQFYPEGGIMLEMLKNDELTFYEIGNIILSKEEFHNDLIRNNFLPLLTPPTHETHPNMHFFYVKKLPPEPPENYHGGRYMDSIYQLVPDVAQKIVTSVAFALSTVFETISETRGYFSYYRQKIPVYEGDPQHTSVKIYAANSSSDLNKSFAYESNDHHESLIGGF